MKILPSRIAATRASLFCGLWRLSVLLACVAIPAKPAAVFPAQANSQEEVLTLPGEIGRPGGRLFVSLRAEPKTLNPLTAADALSREVILSAMQADLVHINRATHSRNQVWQNRGKFP
jgi:hypothetical protein